MEMEMWYLVKKSTVSVYNLQISYTGESDAKDLWVYVYDFFYVEHS